MDMKLSIREVIEKLGQSPRSYYAFESFMLRLLDEHLKANGKVLQTESEISGPAGLYRHRLDALVPDGIDGLPGPTLIEIKLSKHPQILVKVIDRLAAVAARAECKSVLLIFGNELRISYRIKLEDFWRQSSPNIPLEIWDIEKIDAVLAEHSETLAPLLGNLTEFRLRSVVEKPLVDWRQQREDRLRDIASDYSDGNITLVLGAGVSIDSGLPDWSSLLDSLFVRLLTRELAEGSDIRDEEIEAIVKRLKDVDDPSPLMTARYLRKGLTDSPSNVSGSFHSTVGNVLYESAKRHIRSDTWVKALAKMTHPRRTGAKVKAVVTYNFDDLLEKELAMSGDLYRSIFREGETAANDELPIYHVHGFLPEDRDAFDHLEESTLVFSEEGYHEIYVDSYHWSNLVQLNLLRESTCLFVGLSLTDPNLRRLLEISARRAGNSKHFALMQRMDVNSFSLRKGKRVLRARKKCVQQFLENHHRIKEELFRELSVSIIWFEDYKEVPRLLKRIQK
ncbi:MAG: SIR2 family protein [Desulfobacteraceae bacterium]|nr:SIR2 family protein [Desulfobacteraceae bacterium]